MACGSGKTLVAQWAARRLVNAGNVAVVTPSLALVDRTLRSWRTNHTGRLDAIAVCAEDTDTEVPIRVVDLPVPVTVEEAAVTRWLTTGTGIRLVVTTYSSLPVLAAAVRASRRKLSLLILDDAHLIAGRRRQARARVLDPSWIPAQRRLLMTSTERTSTEDIDGIAPTPSQAHPMGPVLARYTTARGISDGYLPEYRIAVVGIAEQDARRRLADYSTKYNIDAGEVILDMLVAQMALHRAAGQFGLRRVVSFHSKTEHAALFARTIEDLADDPNLHADHIDGSMTPTTRARKLQSLRRPPEDRWTVLADAHSLRRGADLPGTDAILFAHPKETAGDVAGAISSALGRHPPTGRASTIVVPILLPETSSGRADEFHTLWNVLRCIRTHDETFASALDHARAHAVLHESLDDLPAQISLSMPLGPTDPAAEQLKTMLLQRTTSRWWDGYGHALAYRAEFGDLAVSSWYCACGYELGRWISRTRESYWKGGLSADRVKALADLGMRWTRHGPDDYFARALQACVRYKAEFGNLRVAQNYITPDGFWLGSWIGRKRSEARRGTLSHDKIEKLSALGMVWNVPDMLWQNQIEKAHTYLNEHGHLRPDRNIPAEAPLAGWISRQRSLHAKGKLSTARLADLTELGINLDRETTTEQSPS